MKRRKSHPRGRFLNRQLECRQGEYSWHRPPHLNICSGMPDDHKARCLPHSRKESRQSNVLTLHTTQERSVVKPLRISHVFRNKVRDLFWLCTPSLSFVPYAYASYPSQSPGPDFTNRFHNLRQAHAFVFEYNSY